jgi:hypothetical protein
MEQLELPLNKPTIPKQPSCWSCKHFSISWVVSKPYKCNNAGIMSTSLPCVKDCDNFTVKSN